TPVMTAPSVASNGSIEIVVSVFVSMWNTPSPFILARRCGHAEGGARPGTNVPHSSRGEHVVEQSLVDVWRVPEDVDLARRVDVADQVEHLAVEVVGGDDAVVEGAPLFARQTGEVRGNVEACVVVACAGGERSSERRDEVRSRVEHAVEQLGC